MKNLSRSFASAILLLLSLAFAVAELARAAAPSSPPSTGRLTTELRPETGAGARAHDVRPDTATVWNDAKLRGVSFRAAGLNPDWILEIVQGDTVVLALDGGSTRITAPTSKPEPDAHGGRTIYRLHPSGHPLVVTLEPGACRDGRSGEELPTRVTVERDRQLLRGCGKSLR